MEYFEKASSGSFGQVDFPIEETEKGEHDEIKHAVGSDKDSHDVPKKKTFLRQIGCTLPPSSFVARTSTRVFIVVLAWAVLWSIIGEDALPDGNIFGIFMVILFSSLGGFLVRCIPCLVIPPLLGMLVAGFVLNNVPGIDVARAIDKKWSSSLRSMALVVILIRSGLGLNTDALRKLKFTCVRLAFVPCIAEALTAAVIVHFVLDMEWLWAFQLGFVQAAVSLAVVIPSLLDLQAKLYGVEKGIPTLVMAAASFDNVMCISAFGICLGMAFSSGNLIFTIFRGPIELVMGISFGVFVGVVCWYFPSRTEGDVSRNRFVILLLCATFAVFGSNVAKFSGAGALAVLTMATVAALKWGKDGKTPIAGAMAIVWTFFEPLLFGLVGAQVNVEYMESSLVGKGMGMLAVSLIVRFIVTYFVLLGNDLDKKERLFIAIAWLPKATVQAAIGSISLDTARMQGFTGQYQEQFGIQILTIAVLGILVTSPIGAIGISVAGPRTLQQAQPDNQRNSEGAPLQKSSKKITEV